MTGVAVAKDGTILALNHGENHADPALGYLRELIKKPAVLVIDPKTGKLLRSWGSNLFILPHHLSVDAAGCVWIVDSALKSVFKFDQNGVKLMELKGADFGFQMPTDVAVFKDGTFLVADGSMNKRGMRFNADGELQEEWGQRGEGLPQFHSPHSLAVDDAGLVYVADRENRWIQVLNAEGERVSTWSKVGRPACVRFHAGSVWVLSNVNASKGIVRRFNTNGQLLEAFHTRPAGAKGDFEWPHSLAITDDGNTVYVGFILTSRQILRYRRKPNA
jgi:peptidylamidoglycolate lyase